MNTKKTKLAVLFAMTTGCAFLSPVCDFGRRISNEGNQEELKVRATLEELAAVDDFAEAEPIS